MPPERCLEPAAAAQRKLQRTMTRFHNANPDQQLEMLLKAEEGLKLGGGILVDTCWYFSSS